MQNKKILFIINGLGYGGAETQLLRLSLAFVNKGYSISLITLTKDLALEKQLDNIIKHYNIPLQKGFSIFSNLRRVLKAVRDEEPDVIHAHLFQANIISRFIKFFNKKIRVINTTHGSYLLNTRKYNPYKIYKFTNKLVDYHTAVSQEVLDLLRIKNSINKKKSSYIPNGLFVNQYTQESVKYSPFKWLAIGRFHLVKDYQSLIKACVIIKEKHTEFELHIAGEGEERSNLENLITESGLEHHVKLLGLVDDIPNLLKKYTSFVISSYSEGLPMVLLEAMSASLPVVSTDVGEIGEILNQAKGGVLVTSRDSLALANAMVDMMSYDRSRLTNLGTNNRNFVQKNYDIDNLVDTWLSIYFKY